MRCSSCVLKIRTSMSSNPYIVRTDSILGFLGFLEQKDLESQNMAVEKLGDDCVCSRLIQQLQTRYLKILYTTPTDEAKLTGILAEIKQIQTLQTDLHKNKFSSYREFKNASNKLHEGLNKIDSITSTKRVTDQANTPVSIPAARKPPPGVKAENTQPQAKQNPQEEEHPTVSKSMLLKPFGGDSPHTETARPTPPTRTDNTTPPKKAPPKKAPPKAVHTTAPQSTTPKPFHVNVPPLPSIKTPPPPPPPPPPMLSKADYEKWKAPEKEDGTDTKASSEVMEQPSAPKPNQQNPAANNGNGGVMEEMQRKAAAREAARAARAESGAPNIEEQQNQRRDEQENERKNDVGGFNTNKMFGQDNAVRKAGQDKHQRPRNSQQNGQGAGKGQDDEERVDAETRAAMDRRKVEDDKSEAAGRQNLPFAAAIIGRRNAIDPDSSNNSDDDFSSDDKKK